LTRLRQVNGSEAMTNNYQEYSFPFNQLRIKCCLIYTFKTGQWKWGYD